MDSSAHGVTKQYALIGDPVSHSISPFIQNSIFEAKRSNSRYIPLQVKPQDLAETVTVLRERFEGFNVTIPHKQAVMKYLDEIHPYAHLCGAVNTVRNDKGRLVGFNTDGYGFMQAFAQVGLKISHRDVLLLGAGGSARAVLCELLRCQCRVTIINRSLAKARQLQQDLAGLPGTAVVGEPGGMQGLYDCIINTTPLGMAPYADRAPIDLDCLHGVQIVYDLIYNPYETKLLQAAKAQKLTAINGFPMLFYQALEANRLWLEFPLTQSDVKNLYQQALLHLKKLQ